MKKAIVYINEINPGYCKSSIGCDEQLDRILRYCKDNDISVVEVVRESEDVEDLLSRPGVLSVLGKCKGIDYIVVERPWCLARRASLLDRFLGRLDQAGVRLVCATHLWDCASQHVRRFQYGRAAAVSRSEDKDVVETKEH